MKIIYLKKEKKNCTHRQTIHQVVADIDGRQVNTTGELGSIESENLVTVDPQGPQFGQGCKAFT